MKTRIFIGSSSRYAYGVVAALFLVVTDVSAGDFGIQIGAYAEAPSIDIEPARGEGDIYSAQTNAGLTVLVVGRYPDAATARAQLGSVRAVGYSDAFVRSFDGLQSIALVDATVVSERSGEAGAFAHGLTGAEQDKLVLVDGQPFIKEADVFVPLQEYLERRKHAR